MKILVIMAMPDDLACDCGELLLLWCCGATVWNAHVKFGRSYDDFVFILTVSSVIIGSSLYRGSVGALWGEKRIRRCFGIVRLIIGF